MQRIQPDASESEIATEADAIMAASAEKVLSGDLWTRQLRKPIMLAILIAFFNKVSGINESCISLHYFAPRIFGLTGARRQSSIAPIHRNWPYQSGVHICWTLVN